MAADDTGLRSAYDQYAKDVKSLQAACDSVNKRAKDMRAKKADYLQAWTKDKAEVQNEELRLIAKERKAETTAAFERVRTELDRASTAFVPFMSNLNDIQKVIGNDLTPEGRGLVAQTAVVANANDHGNAVVAIMDSAMEELKKVAARVSPTGVAPTS
jgi:alpha-galactosidase/6-phospho-beta-glucosidase family protein